MAPVIVPLYSWGGKGIEKGCFIITVIIMIIIITIVINSNNNNNNRIGSEREREQTISA